jgi:hypothetical protein
MFADHAGCYYHLHRLFPFKHMLSLLADCCVVFYRAFQKFFSQLDDHGGLLL